MKLIAKQDNYRDHPSRSKYINRPGKIFLTIEKQYEVWAIAKFEDLIFLQVINDIDYPAWYDSWLFDIVEMSLPHDWVCNLFNDEPSLILGPSFIVKDITSYNAMVELEPESVKTFWERVKTTKGN
jgi:hypothetical protein